MAISFITMEQPQHVLLSIDEDATPTTPCSPSPRASARRHPSRKDTIHKPQEWDSLRGIIGQLYIEENKTLTNIIEILETRYNFIATPKQYKIRFKQWGFWKNLSSQNANHLLQMKESRDSLGKPSTFVRSGHKLDINRIEKTIRRSRRTPQERSVENNDANSGCSRLPAQLPVGIECRTPSPEPGSRPDDDIPDANDSFMLGSKRSWPASPSALTLGSVPSMTAGETLVAPDVFTPEFASIAPDYFPICSLTGHDQFSRLARCYNIAQKKLATASGRGILTSAALQAFKSRNILLAILEPVIGRHRMAELFLRNFAVAFENDRGFTSFIKSHVVPNIGATQLGEPSDTLRVVQDSIDTAISSLDSTGSTRRLLEKIETEAGGTDHDVISFQSSWDDNADFEEFIVPSALSPSTDFSASTEADIKTPPTPTEIAPIAYGLADYGSHLATAPLASQFEVAAQAYLSGEVSAQDQFQSIAAYERVKTAKGKVLTRMAWYCLSRISGQLGRASEAGTFLMQAVRGSMYFCDEEGDEWQEVSHLFV